MSTVSTRFVETKDRICLLLTTVQFEVLKLLGSPRAWLNQGTSFDAFTDDQDYDTSYLGPFNGHVNGALVMKERTE